MKKRVITSAITLCFGLSFFAPGASAASPDNVFLCKEASYKCVNEGYSGVTGYSGFDGPYGYDTDEFGAHIMHNCTSYVAYRFYKIMGYRNPAYNRFGMAYDWDTNVKKYVPGSTVGSVPHVGDIAQWNFGHVAWVEHIEYTATGDVAWIVISDDNYGLKITSQRKLFPGQNSGVISWPDNFIGLPIFYGGGGGKPPVAMLQPLTSP